MFVVYNDVSSNLDNVPDFIQLDKGVDGKYDPSFKDKQRKKNPEMKSLTVPRDSTSLAHLQEAIKTVLTKEVGLTFVAEDAATNRQQFLATTRLFRFKDDIVVQVAVPSDAAQPYEVVTRSKSRVGKGDFGANAARINNFYNLLGKYLQKHPSTDASAAAASSAVSASPATPATVAAPADAPAGESAATAAAAAAAAAQTAGTAAT